MFGNKKSNIRQTYKCPKCGSKCEKGFKFCPMCAYPQKIEEIPEFKKEREMANPDEPFADEFQAFDEIKNKDCTGELEAEPEITEDDKFDIADVRLNTAPRNDDKELQMLYS